MASRRRAREFALQALYQSDLTDTSVSAALNHLWSGLVDGEGIDGVKPAESEEIEFAQRVALGVQEHKERIDTLLEEASSNWRLPRMPVVDRNILRLATYELLECQDIPATVSINEAVELAKGFGTSESRAFVNGIVDRVARTLGRIQSGGRRRGKNKE